MFTTDKITNNLTQKGKKTKGEKILKKSIKELQKSSKKQAKNLMQLSFILSSNIFKTRTIKNKTNKKQKARIKPSFITNKQKRFSFAIKLIIAKAKENRTSYFYCKLKEELFCIAVLKNSVIQITKDLEKQALKNKHLLKYYRWDLKTH